MKVLLLLLLLLNALFFGWSRWVAVDPYAGRIVTPEPDAARLELAARVPVSADAGVSIRDDVVAVRDEPVVTVQLDGAADVSNVAEENSAQAELTASPLARAESIDPAIVASVAPPRCLTVGPFNTLARANGAAALWRDNGGTVTSRSEAGQVWVGHWVFLPAARSLSAAEEVVSKLREDGVRDLYIEKTGPDANVVSLGLFSDVTRAERRAGQLRRLGVKPQIRDRFRNGERVWLEIAAPAGAGVNHDPFEVGPVRLDVTERPCNGAG